MTEEFSKSFWDEHYGGRHEAAGADPNPQLVAETTDLPPGKALDAGCGEGAEAIWLASRGWTVTAVDVAATALRRARERAERTPATSGRITWVQADLATWTPPEEEFDLVCSHYVHIAGSRDRMFGRLAGAVAPGGTLLIVGHDPSDQVSSAHTSAPEVLFTAEQIAVLLADDRWEITIAETRTRDVGHGHGHGHGVILRDAVVRARRR